MASCSSSSSSLFVSLKCFIWDSLSTYFFFLFALFRTRVFRSKKSNGMEGDGDGSDRLGTEMKLEKVAEEDCGDDLMEGEESGLGFSFKFQSYEEFSRSRRKEEDEECCSGVLTTQKSFCKFLEELEKGKRNGVEDDEAVKEEGEGMNVEDEESKACSVMESPEEEVVVSDDSESSTGSVPLRMLMNRLLDSFTEEEEEDRELQKPVYIDSVSSEEEEEEEEEHVYTTEELTRIEEAHYKQSAMEASSEHGESDESDTDSSLEHEELMEQLKMELENVKLSKGLLLPTIEEDSEYSKIPEDLKPWKMEEKIKKDDQMDSLLKFHKIYRERMKKLDILNSQKMYAMGLVQLKNGVAGGDAGGEGGMFSRSSSQSWLCKRKKIQNVSTLKSLKDLQDDMEVVYVGQLCLSWDFLHLQYKTAVKIWQSDDRRLRRYSDVALHFQRFQVLMTRFIEEEPFRGPRVQHYVKTRCILRNLLQIPLIREDKKRRNGDLAYIVVSSDTLVEIIEECIRIFWRFLRADKDSRSSGGLKFPSMKIPNCRIESTLLIELRNDVRKLRSKLKGENCLLRKFRRVVQKEHVEEDEDDEEEPAVYFFSKVEVRLVVRVLNMPGLTMEQLAWCRTKLNNITFTANSIHLGPSFLLFPV